MADPRSNTSSSDSSPQPEAVETDPRFPTGRWVGQYIQSGRRSKQELWLVFSDGRVEGGGDDPVGWFAISGTYNTETGRTRITKRYPGRWTVEYDGTAEVKHGIWGLWHIPHDSPANKGGFQLWPFGTGAQNADAAHAAAPDEAEAPEPVFSGREVVAMPAD
jgi:hypothetical protein